jgi:hypothetical protein
MKEANLTTFFEVEVGLRTSVLGLACDSAVLSLFSVAFGLSLLYHRSWPVLRIFLLWRSSAASHLSTVCPGAPREIALIEAGSLPCLPRCLSLCRADVTLRAPLHDVRRSDNLKNTATVCR